MPSLGQTVAVAVHEATPRTMKGLAAQGAAVAALSTVSASWRARAALMPVAATCAAAGTSAVWPGQTALGLGALAVAGVVSSRSGPAAATGAAAGTSAVWTARDLRASGLARWALGGLAWVGAGALGGHEALVWWQDGALLAALIAPGAATWWRASRLPEVVDVDQGPARPPTLPPPAHVLREVLTTMTWTEGTWLTGGAVVEVLSPAAGVAVALVELPHGTHSARAAGADVRLGLEAVLSAAGRAMPGLGALDPSTVQIEPVGVEHMRVSASWSRALDAGALPWKPPADLEVGRVWLGHDDARADLVVPSWYRGDDGKTSVVHVWVIGRTGGGKSTTIRSYLAPGIEAGNTALILLDGKGDSLEDLAPYSLTGHVARDGDSWRQGVILAYAIMVARQQRLVAGDPWRGPTPADPLIALIIDECATVATGLTKAEIRMICEIGRLGRSLGVMTLQSGQIPLVDSLIGGSEWRSQARLVIGHGVQDKTHNHVATQSGAEDSGEAVSLLGLPIGRAAALYDGVVLSRRAKVALMTEADLQRVAAAEPAVLHPGDRSPEVQALLELAGSWANSRPQSVVDLGDLLAEWVDVDPSPVVTDAQPEIGPRDASIDLTTLDGPEPLRSGTRVPAPRAAVAPAQDRGKIRTWILSHLLVHHGLTRSQLVAAVEAAGWSRSGAYKAMNEVLDDGAVIEEGGRLTPAALWQA
ncbi:hypothetical protein [Kineosporia sp. A_224]|uniref:hypothetical protein n=1 Tax=Kineosporia sp. A_224 TaxID=1962180 RepID=UPI00117A0738|nr:hypothetical protein [Kineosporia sp. A_224]